MNRITRTAIRLFCFIMLAGLLIAGGAGSAWAYVGGDFNNLLADASYSLTGGADDNPTPVGTEGHAWDSSSFTPGATSSTPEFSRSFDWSGTASPQRDVGTLLMFPNQVSGNMNFSVYSSTSTPASPNYSLAQNATVNVGSLQYLLVQKLNLQAVTGIKFEDVQNGTSTSRRDIGGLVALAETVDIVQPNSATASQTLNVFYNSGNAINVSTLVDGDFTTGVDFGGSGTQGQVADAYVEVTFATAQNLVGVLVVLDTYITGAWKTWEVRDLNNIVLATSQVGAVGSPTASCDRFQLLGFTGGAQTLTGFRIYGKVGSPDQNNTNNRIKEIIGLSVPPPVVVTKASHVNVTCNGGANGVIELNTATGGSGAPYQYSKNGVDWQVSTTFSDLAAGTYQMKARDSALAESDNVEVIITEPAVAVAVTEKVASHVNVTCNGGANGVIELNTATGGSGAGYQYSKDGGSTWQVGTTFSDLAAGTYQMKAKDGNSCESDNVEVIITEPAVAVGGLVRTIAVSGYTGSLQWQKSASASGPWIDIGGATSASLDVSSDYLATPYFRAQVTSGVGCNDAVYSSVAKVTDSEPVFNSGTVFMFQ